MEEEKKLDSTAADTIERKEPTYEELKDWCNQLMMQRNQIAQRLNQVTDVINKLPWLFEVIKAKDVFDSEFVNICIKDIETILTPPKEEESNNKTEG